MPYDSYDDWYDNGPGSEAFKRSCNKPNVEEPWEAISNKSFNNRRKLLMECKKCMFGKTKQGKGKKLECHRYPPTEGVVTKDGMKEFPSWPDVKPTQWCGEFRHPSPKVCKYEPSEKF